MAKSMIAAALVLFVACGSPAPNQTAQQPAVAAPLPTGTLDQLLAPIALYPDQLLAQILMSATNPSKVTELAKWLKSNANLKGTELQDAAVKAGFDASFVALALFPQVVSRMAEQIAWTRVLGQAFDIRSNRCICQHSKTEKTGAERRHAEEHAAAGGRDEKDVIRRAGDHHRAHQSADCVRAAIQHRGRLHAAPQLSTVIIQEDDDDAEMAIAAGLIGFTAGIAIGAAMDNHYYYGPYGWHGGGYMYNDAWDDYYDHREDARDDWMDHREDLVEERSDRLEDRGDNRSDRLENTQEQRTDRQQNRQENRPAAQAERAERTTQAQSASTPRATQAQSASTQRASTQSASGKSYCKRRSSR